MIRDMEPPRLVLSNGPEILFKFAYSYYIEHILRQALYYKEKALKARACIQCSFEAFLVRQRQIMHFPAA